MNLLEIRQKFIKLSGRADLAKGNNNDTDAGADFFIRSASMDLDLEQDHIHTGASFVKAFAVDDYELDMKHCRLISAVYYEDTDREQVRIDLLSYQKLVKNYPKLGSTTSGTPADYALQPVRRAPEQIASGKPIELISAIIMPPVDTATTITVHGDFFSYPLTQNDDVNYWSENFDYILVLAALRNMEGFYRNSQGYKDWDLLVKERLEGLDKNLADWSTVENLNIKG